MGELLFLGLLLIGSGILFYLTFSFQVYFLDKSGGAGLFPRIVIIFLCIFLIARIIIVLKNKKEAFVFLELFKGMRLFFLSSLAGYIVMVKIFGYQITTIVFLLITVNVFYYKTKGNWGKPSKMVLRNIGIVIFVLTLKMFFSGILKVLLPVGDIFAFF